MARIKIKFRILHVTKILNFIFILGHRETFYLNISNFGHFDRLSDQIKQTLTSFAF